MDSYISFLTSIIMANRNMGFKVGSGAGSNSSSFNSKASSNSNTNNSGDREDPTLYLGLLHVLSNTGLYFTPN